MDNYYSRESTKYYQSVLYRPEPFYFEDMAIAVEDVCDYKDLLQARFSGQANLEDHDWALRELAYLKYPYIKQGMIYHTLFTNHTWSATNAKSFKDYCKIFLGLSYFRVKDTVNASALACDLIRMEFNILPTGIAMCKLLQKVKEWFLANAPDPHDDYEYALRRIWSEFILLDEINRDNRHLKAIIDRQYSNIFPIKNKKQIMLDMPLFLELEKAAVANNITVEEIIENHVIDAYICPNFDTKEEQEIKEAAWRMDMQELVENNSLLDEIKSAIHKINSDINYQLVIREVLSCKDFIEDVIARIFFRQAIAERKKAKLQQA